MGRMVHIPVNHQLQPLYRTLSGLIGAYLVAFGITGVIVTRGTGAFQQHGLPSALGLHANRAFAILSIVVGVVLLVGAIIGRNLDQRINLYGSMVFILAGLFMLIFLNSRLNFLGFTPATCIVSLIIGLALLVCGLYGKVGVDEDVRREEEFRHGTGRDPNPAHRFSAPNLRYDPHAQPQGDESAGKPATGRPLSERDRDRQRAA
jgi:cell shape-determining protein MreD